MRFLQRGNPFWCSNQNQHFDAGAARFLQQIDGGDHGTAGRQHRVDHQRQALFNVRDQLLEVGNRLQGFFITVNTHHADTGAGDVLQHPFHHAQAGTQNRDHSDFFAFDLVDLYRAIPALNGDALCFQIGGRFVGQQAAHFRGQLAKTLCADIMLTHQAQFMFDQRVSDFHDLHWCSPGMS